MSIVTSLGNIANETPEFTNHTISKITPSTQQLSIFRWLSKCQHNTIRHLIVEALAGTGKTWTMLQGLLKITSNQSILVAAFNTSIKEEVSQKVAKLFAPNSVAQWASEGFKVIQVYNGYASLKHESKKGKAGFAKRPIDCPVDVSTWHSYGMKLVKRYYSLTGWNIVDKGWRSYSLAYDVVAPHFDLPIPRPRGKVDMPPYSRRVINLVKKLHCYGRSINPFADVDDLTALAFRFDCTPNESLEDEGWDVTRIAQLALNAMKLAAKGPTEGKIDYDDMIFLPVYHKMVKPSHDIVFVDERQDLNWPMLHMAECAAKDTLGLFGDVNQAIYGFRGADSDFADTLDKDDNTTTLTLTKTFRCCKAVVRVAKQLVPTYEAFEDNPEGEVSYIETSDQYDDLFNEDEVQQGDAIISRYNAPLIYLVLGYIKRGIPACMRGNDFCKAVSDLITNLVNNETNVTVPTLLTRLNKYQDEQTLRIKAKSPGYADSLIEILSDKCDTVRALAEDAKTIDHLQHTLNRIFRAIESNQCITLCSVHKAKGLEWGKVYVLADTLQHHKGHREERNIAYVALTRAISHLVIVNGYKGMFKGEWSDDGSIPKDETSISLATFKERTGP